MILLTLFFIATVLIVKFNTDSTWWINFQRNKEFMFWEYDWYIHMGKLCFSLCFKKIKNNTTIFNQSKWFSFQIIYNCHQKFKLTL